MTRTKGDGDKCGCPHCRHKRGEPVRAAEMPGFRELAAYEMLCTPLTPGEGEAAEARFLAMNADPPELMLPVKVGEMDVLVVRNFVECARAATRDMAADAIDRDDPVLGRVAAAHLDALENFVALVLNPAMDTFIRVHGGDNKRPASSDPANPTPIPAILGKRGVS